jgi:hypothetical protein
MIFQRPFEKLLEKSVRVHWHLSLSVIILKKPKLRDLKAIPDFADEVNDIIWRQVNIQSLHCSEINMPSSL